MRIHAIQAGTVAVMSARREGVGRGKRPLGRSGFHFDLINRIDGVKMLALAAMAVAGVRLVRRTVLPRWLGDTAAFLTVALIASGAGYLLLNTTLAQAAFVSGPPLLVWVTGVGIALARTSRSGQGGGMTRLSVGRSR